MTIVAGFKCSDGVVLAADTQVTNWNTYSYECKILDISGSGLDCYLAYSGDVLLTKEVQQEFKNALRTVPNEDELISTIRVTASELHRRYFTNAAKDDKSKLQMLAAIRTNEAWNLFLILGSRFVPIDRYHLLGIGEDTARVIFESRYSTALTIQEAGHLAAYGLRLIKKHVPGCGGDSDVYLFENNWLGEIPDRLKRGGIASKRPSARSSDRPRKRESVSDCKGMGPKLVSELRRIRP